MCGEELLIIFVVVCNWCLESIKEYVSSGLVVNVTEFAFYCSVLLYSDTRLFG